MKKKVLLLMFSLSLNIISNAQTKKVPQEYSTIQSAINDAANGDTVLVDTGTYIENISFQGKNIVVCSKYAITGDNNFITKTIIDGSNPATSENASVVQFLNHENDSAVIQGFTIQHGSGTRRLWEPWGTYTEGGGIVAEYSTPQIKNNIIMNNSADGGGGGGISALHSFPLIKNNLIISNKSRYAGGIVFNASGGMIKNNLIWNNKSEDWSGGGIIIWDKSSNDSIQIIENNTIVCNTTTGNEGGIKLHGTAHAIVKNNIIRGNKQKGETQVNSNNTYSTVVYNCIQDNPFTGGNNTDDDPLFATESMFDILPGSPCIDAGDTSEMYNDLPDMSDPDIATDPSKGTLRNDMGVYGGPYAEILPFVRMESFIYSSEIDFGDNAETDIPVLKDLICTNMGNTLIQIDSVVLMSNSTIVLKNNIEGEIETFGAAELKVEWSPAETEELNDSLLIYHNLSEYDNPVVIYLTGKTAEETSASTVVNNKRMHTVINPNPFDYKIEIKYNIPDTDVTLITLNDITGKTLDIIENSSDPAGNHTVSYNTGYLPEGIYFIKFQHNNIHDTIKIIKR